jgi:hypothetical protein
MFAKMPDALAAFAVDLQNVDLSELGGALGEQTHAWEIFGEVTSRSKELTLTVNFERTDLLPLNDQLPAGKNRGAVQSANIPGFEDSSAYSDLFKLLGKTIIGAEGKITLKFEKRKVAQLLTETPKLLSAVLKNEFTEKTAKQFYGK